MEDLMIKLLNEKMSFVFDGVDIIVGDFDTGYYGKVKTTISYDKTFNLYHVSYGTRGYPYSKTLRDVDNAISFIKEIHYQN